MSRDFIEQLYLHTPLWLWPVLWVEIYWMQGRLARLPDAHDPKDLYEVRLNNWGQLQLIKLYTHVETPDLDAWKSGSRLDSDLFATNAYLTPHLRRMPESLRGIRNRIRCDFPEQAQTQAPGCLSTQLTLTPKSLYLDPG